MVYINILFVNMCHHNAASHSLLNTNTTADVIMVQEPWYNRIGMTHSDSDPEGVDILGGVSNPKWDCIYPKTNCGERCKVMAYHRISSTHFNVTNHLDLASCHHILTLDIHLGSSEFWAINVYHDMDHHTSLNNILSINMDPHTLTLIGGNFNTHSRMWSPPGIWHSSWADNLEDWAIGQNLALASPLGVLTQRGKGTQCDTMINLIWTNTVALLDDTFQEPIIDFTALVGSDHAGIWITYQHVLEAAIQPPPHLSHFIIVDKAQEQWIQHYLEISPPVPPTLMTIADLD
jgi:hypothetical protein